MNDVFTKEYKESFCVRVKFSSQIYLVWCGLKLDRVPHFGEKAKISPNYESYMAFYPPFRNTWNVNENTLYYLSICVIASHLFFH